MKIQYITVDPNNVSDALIKFNLAIANHAGHIKSVSNANKRVAFGVVCVSGAVYLTYKFAKKQAERINQLEQTVNTLVQIAVGEKPQEQQQTEE